jgi:succinyl-CoA synthetase alpha subunit
MKLAWIVVLVAGCASPVAIADAATDVNGPDVNCSPRATYGCVCRSGLASYQICDDAGTGITECICTGWDGARAEDASSE